MLKMKKTLGCLILLLAILATTSFAQSSEASQSIKKSQEELVNEVAFSYGLGSMFYITQQNSSNNYQTSGAFILGYSRSLGKIISIGFQAVYQSITHSTSGGTAVSYYDNYWSGLANIKFRYYNRPTFSIYSGVGIGITMDYSKEVSTSSGERKYQHYYPAGQLTLLGFRVGRSLSFFGEFGLGTSAILNAGLSYKFGE